MPSTDQPIVVEVFLPEVPEENEKVPYGDPWDFYEPATYQNNYKGMSNDDRFLLRCNGHM